MKMITTMNEQLQRRTAATTKLPSAEHTRIPAERRSRCIEGRVVTTNRSANGIRCLGTDVQRSPGSAQASMKFNPHTRSGGRSWFAQARDG